MTLTEIKTVIHEDIDKINDAELLDILKPYNIDLISYLF